MTIIEKYYAMNTALNLALKAQSQVAQVYKYGTVPEHKKYPYFQSVYRIQRRQPYASSVSGVLTDFEYTLNFYTAAISDEKNDVALFTPYEIARELITSPESMIWRNIAVILNHDETPGFKVKGGLEVLQRGLIFNCQTVTSFVSTIHGGTEIPTDDIIETIQDALEADEY
ncbi:MAG: hypothetical protein PHN88_15940 [Ignavibacteria bacterium]|nr:hypothetical protein [Ignavibacteria bacterium]